MKSSAKNHLSSDETKCSRTNVKRKKSVKRRNKKHRRKRPDVQLKEFPLTKQKTRPRTDYERTGKTI